MAMPDTMRSNGESDPDNLDGSFASLIGNQSDPRGAKPAELELAEDDVRLPWLEGEDDEDEYRGGGGGQLAFLVLMAVAALALIIGGIWWFTRGGGDGELIADGGVIEAPDRPYKEKPADPGGKTFQGTGDTSFAVSEGETRPARLGQSVEAPQPGFEGIAANDKPSESGAQSADKASPAPKAEASSEPAPPTGPAVQVGAYNSREVAESSWNRMVSHHPILSGQRYRVLQGRAEFGTVYRLQVFPGDAAAARSLCTNLKRAGQDCTVKN